MGEWKETTLGQLLESRGYIRGPFGSSLLRGEMKENGIPVYEQKNAIYNSREFRFFIDEEKFEELKRFQVRTNDLIISCSGTFGKISIIRDEDPKGIISQALLILRPDVKKVVLEYLYYFLSSKRGLELISQVSHGSVQINIAERKVVESIPLVLPTLSEQFSIVSILSSLDDKIDLLHRQNKTLEQLAETLFVQWFVENQTTFGKLGNLVEATFGGEWGKEVQESDYNFPVYCIRGTDIADLQVGLANRTPLRYVKEKKYKSIEMRNGDLVMEISGGSDGQSTGRTILINEDVKSLFSYPLVFSNFCRLIRPINPESGLYLLCYINMLYDQGDFFNLENGSSGIRNFDYKALLFELDYEIHDSSQILNFNKAVKPYFEKINKNKFQIRTLTQLRDTLLPKLMSGEVRVKVS